MFSEIAYQVPLENGETIDIIAFYNQVFIQKLRPFLCELPNMTPDMLFGNIGGQGGKSNEHKSNSGKEIPQIKSNKLAKAKPKSLIPEDILQSP